jgi:hypothetical protein
MKIVSLRAKSSSDLADERGVRPGRAETARPAGGRNGYKDMATTH